MENHFSFRRILLKTVSPILVKFIAIRMTVAARGSQLSFPSWYYNFVFHLMQIYLLDIHIFYTIFSAFLGFLLGARDRLGEVSVVTLLFVLQMSKFRYLNLLQHCL